MVTAPVSSVHPKVALVTLRRLLFKNHDTVPTNPCPREATLSKVLGAREVEDPLRLRLAATAYLELVEALF